MVDIIFSKSNDFHITLKLLVPSYFYTLLKNKIFISDYSISTWRQTATPSLEIISNKTVDDCSKRASSSHTEIRLLG